VRGDSRLLLS